MCLGYPKGVLAPAADGVELVDLADRPVQVPDGVVQGVDGTVEVSEDGGPDLLLTGDFLARTCNGGRREKAVN